MMNSPKQTHWQGALSQNPEEEEEEGLRLIYEVNGVTTESSESEYKVNK